MKNILMQWNQQEELINENFIDKILIVNNLDKEITIADGNNVYFKLMKKN